MILKLIEAIAKKIKIYYPDYEFINDKLEQNFGKTMHITILPTTVTRAISDRYDIRARIMITIFNDNLDEIMEVCRNIYSILEFLEFEETILRGTNFSFSIHNENGVVDLTYTISESLNKEKIRMNNLKFKGSISNEKN